MLNNKTENFDREPGIIKKEQNCFLELKKVRGFKLRTQ